METKRSKIFAKKLIALVLSVLMAASCFTGALTAFAASKQTDKDYHDANLAANFMSWAETSDEQTCEALLDWADMHLSDLMTSLLGSDHLYFSQNIVVDTIKIDAYLDSVDGLFDLFQQADDLLDGYGNLVGGDVKNINLDPVGDDLKPLAGGETMSQSGKAYRANYSAKELVMALAKFLYINSNDFGGKNVIGQFVKGSLSLGSIIEKALGGNVYSLLQNSLGMWSGYEYNLVYNIVANLILENTKWFDDATLAKYKEDLRKTKASDRTFAFNFDDVLFTALNKQLLQEIHAEITYPNYVENAEGKLINDSSVQRYRRICEAMNVDPLDKTVDQQSAAFVAAAKADAAAHNYSYNPNIIYFTNNTKDNSATADMDLDTGCVYLFKYRNSSATDGVNKLELAKTDNLFSFAFRALEFAWDTALEDTLGLVHVNYDVDRGHGANFDNEYFYWVAKNGTWNYTDWKSNYSASKVEAWADATYADYGCKSAAEFLSNVKHTFEYDRSVVDDAKNNWQDIDSTTLFNKLRYNPLADLYFDMQTGPINLYFEQTGISDISTFFDTAFTSYSNMVAGLNDALVAITKVVFLDSKNIGYGTTDENKVVTNLSVPAMQTTGDTIDKSTITSTLVKNVFAMIEYVANTTDANILNPYYTANSVTSLSGNLSEANAEEALVPLLVSCLQNVKMTEQIHDEKWDSCKDAEGVAIVALEEYLSFILPDKDYSVLWTYDDNGFITAKSGQNLFDNAVMPMCRDALGYIISSVVPCRTADGQEWNVYDSEPTDSTTIFEILNSVICYYASQDSFSDGTKGKAVASLLGVVEKDGTCKVKMSNTIWQNLDAIVNTLLPAIGTFQYGDVSYYGKASTEDLIYNDLIKGILDIGTANANGKMGITNFLERLITIVTSSPISSNKATPHDDGSSITNMVYNFVADIVNGFFGARYTGQGYDKVIPYAEWYDKDAYSDTKTATPFDSLLTTSTLGHYSASNDVTDKYDTGVIGILICNIYEAFGGGYENKGTAGCWTGAMFAVEAVNNFIPSFVPSLSDHSLNTASAKVFDSSQSGLTAGSAIHSTTLDISNNAIGLNRFYRDANGTVHRDPRYFVYVKSVTQSSQPSGATVTLENGAGKVIAPEKTLRLAISGNAPSADTTFTFTVTYDIFKGEMNGTSMPTYSSDKVVYENVTATAYMFTTTAKDWAGTLFDKDGYINGAYRYTGTKDAGKSNNYTSSSPGYGGSSKFLLATTPNKFIVPMSNAQSVSKYKFYVKNVSNGTFGSDRSFDGMFASLMAGVDYYPVSNGVVSENTTTSTAQSLVAYASIDKTTGDILNYNRYDYTTDDGKTWNRGNVQYSTFRGGFSSADINNLSEDVKDSGHFATRTHVAWTLDEALATGIVYGVKRTPAAVVDGVQTYVYDAVLFNLNSSFATSTPSGQSESVSTMLLSGSDDGIRSISFSTPTPGLYFGASKTKVGKGSDTSPTFVVYDGSTNLDVDNYTMNVNIYTTSNNNMTASVNMIIADDTASATLKKAFNDDLSTFSAYSETDFKDYANGKSQSYQDMAQALKKAVATVSTPINQDNAASLGSTMVTVGKTGTTTLTTGDKAYAPIPTTTKLPAKLMAISYKGTSNIDGKEYWYVNKECTLPLCSNTPLTSADVVDGTNKCGVPVTLVDGVYYYTNAAVYDKEWDTTSYDTPYLANTSTQSTNKDGENLYARTSFTCYDKDGKAMDSRGAWTYTYADTEKQIKVNDGTNDFRGIYQKDIDNLQYYLEQLKKNVNTEIADLIVKQVTDDRNGMNSVNYDVASYEKMVQIARDAEKLITKVQVGDPTYFATNAAGERVAVTLSDQSTPLNTLYEDAAGNLYKDSEVETVYEYAYTTDKSLTQINSAIDMYNEFKGYVQSRGYIGNKLEAEVQCASGYAYTALDYTKDVTTDETTGNETVNSATVTSSTATTAKYGAWENGTLVNKGDVVYTDASWNAYIIALANAIQIADEQTMKVSGVYTAKTDLQIAENNLTEVGSTGGDTITVSGKLTIAEDVTGSAGSFALGGVNITTKDGKVVATSAADGTFTAEVPAGTTELVITGESTIDRTVTLSGTASVSDVVIPVVMCDYNKDGAVNSTDVGLFSQYMGGEYYLYADFNIDKDVNSTDGAIFAGFIDQTISYDAMNLG